MELHRGLIKVVLTEHSRKVLMPYIKPNYENIFATHMTIWFKPPIAIVEHLERKEMFGTDVSMLVTEIRSDGRCVAAVVTKHTVSLDPQPDVPHITIATKGDTPPVYSNHMLSGHSKTEQVSLELIGTLVLETW